MPALIGLADAEPDKIAIATSDSGVLNMLASWAIPNHAGTGPQACLSDASLAIVQS